MKLNKNRTDFISIKEICKYALGILGLFSSITVMASPYSVYIVNKDKNNGDHDILIDYTICNDVLEKNPVCTQHSNVRIMNLYPEKIELKNKNDVLYVWKASTYEFNGQFIENDYSKIMGDPDKPTLVTSDCAAGNRQLLALDTYGTRRIIGCQVANY